MIEESKPKLSNEITIPVPERKEQFVGSLVLKKGHSLYKCNLITFDVSTVKDDEYEERVIDMNGKKTRSLVVKENHIYDTALNLKNAARKFVNRLKGKVKLVSE